MFFFFRKTIDSSSSKHPSVGRDVDKDSNLIDVLDKDNMTIPYCNQFGRELKQDNGKLNLTEPTLHFIPMTYTLHDLL